jgi:nucleoside-diphosphate-sugar epimerase
MKVAITGGLGDLGSTLLRQNPYGHELIAIDRGEPAKATAAAGQRYIQADVCDLPALTDALRGADAVVHLAALRSPHVAPPETVFRVNTLGAYHVTLACEALGIHALVFASSICYFGYLFRQHLVSPPYFPVDEETPAYPEDSYSLSKRVGEQIMQAFVQRTGGAVASLRFAYLYPNGASGIPASRRDVGDMALDERWAKSWWTYVDLEDAGRVTWQALHYISERDHTHEAFNIGADDTHTTAPTRDALQQFFPSADLRHDEAAARDPHIALYSNAKAKRLLSFQPTPPTWRQRYAKH